MLLRTLRIIGSNMNRIKNEDLVPELAAKSRSIIQISDHTDEDYSMRSIMTEVGLFYSKEAVV